jgi:hypothetical protein
MKHYPSHHGSSPGAVIALSLSAFGFAGLLATAAPAATATFTGLVDAQTNPYGYHRVEVSHAGTPSPRNRKLSPLFPTWHTT